MNYFESLDSMEKSIESAPIGLKISTIEYSFDSFLQKIEDGSLSNNAIQNNIFYGIGQYLNYDNFRNPNTHNQFVGLWTNKKFLRNFLEVISGNKAILENVRTTYITTINKIAYDYYYEQFVNTDKWNSEVSQILIDICTTVDYNFILPMTTVVPMNVAIFISISRYSSFDKSEGIRRFNNMIIGCGVPLTIKDIIYIYSQFFSSGFSSLFNITMSSSVEDFKDPVTKQNYDNMSLAIIHILNSIPSTEITTVLKKYSLYISFLDQKVSRFSFQKLSDEFARITTVVNNLIEEGYYVP